MDTPSRRKSVISSLHYDILQLIENKVFLGKYTERRYVESLQAYRDIIIVESSEAIVDNLMKTKELLKTCAGNKWIGISNDPQNSDSNDCLLWVQLKNVPVGKHWFQMSAVNFEEKEIFLEVQHVQPYHAPDKSFNINDCDFPSFDPKEIFTYSNMTEAVKFIAIVFMTLFTFLVEVVRYAADYSIKLSYVIISFVQVSMPIWLGILDFFTKCVAGFYWLIYVMFRGNANTPIIPAALMSSSQKQIGYRNTDYNSPYRRNAYQSFRPDFNNQDQRYQYQRKY